MSEKKSITHLESILEKILFAHEDIQNISLWQIKSRQLAKESKHHGLCELAQTLHNSSNKAALVHIVETKAFPEKLQKQINNVLMSAKDVVFS